MGNSRKRLGWLTAEPTVTDRVLAIVGTLSPCTTEEVISEIGTESSVLTVLYRLKQEGFIERAEGEIIITDLGLAKRDMMARVRSTVRTFLEIEARINLAKERVGGD